MKFVHFWASAALGAFFLLGCSVEQVQLDHDVNSGWVAQNPSFKTGLSCVYFVNGSIGYAVGTGGVIIKTINGGANWAAESSGVTADLNSVRFVDANTGWVVGATIVSGPPDYLSRAVILKTTDGGTTWKSQANSVAVPLRSAYFTDANTGWAVGDQNSSYDSYTGTYNYSGTIIKTTDGGATWTSVSTSTYVSFNSVWFTSASTGYVAGTSGSLLKTIDGGATWAMQSTNVSATLRSVHFIDANRGWVVGDQVSIYSSGYYVYTPTILKTTDGGVNWVPQSGLSTNLFSVYFTDANTGYVGGDTGLLLKTVNGGATWTAQPTGTSLSIVSIQMQSNLGYAVGSGYSYVHSTPLNIILKTANGGTTWANLSQGTASDMLSVHFTDLNTGYAVGNEGVIFKTADGGTSWGSKTSGTKQRLNAVYFTNATTGWAVGDSGVMRKTTNAGASWSGLASGTTQPLNSVYFTNANTGYAAGWGGVILKTVNGGTSWTSQNSGTAQTLKSICFIDAQNGFAAGSAVLLKTANAGTSWSIADSISDNLNALHFPNADTGYAVGDAGIVLQTTDRGASWKEKQRLGADLASVHFVSGLKGYVVGGYVNYFGTVDHPVIYQTLDGGISWSVLYQGRTLPYMRDIHCPASNTCYAVGDGGVFLKHLEPL